MNRRYLNCKTRDVNLQGAINYFGSFSLRTNSEYFVCSRSGAINARWRGLERNVGEILLQSK